MQPLFLAGGITVVASVMTATSDKAAAVVASVKSLSSSAVQSTFASKLNDEAVPVPSDLSVGTISEPQIKDVSNPPTSKKAREHHMNTTTIVLVIYIKILSL
jgi:hypothetical protein